MDDEEANTLTITGGNPWSFGAIVPNGVPKGRDAASPTGRGKFTRPRCYPQLVRPDALNVFGFGTFFAGDDVERHLVSFIQGLETLADDGAVVNEDVLA